MGRLQDLYNNFKVDSDLPKNTDSNVLIIDGLNTFIRVFSAVPALNDDGQHVGGVVGFLKSIGSNIRQFQATRCIVVFDGSGGSQRRRKIFDGYKSGRRNKPQSGFNRFDEFKDLVDEKESIKMQFARLIEYIDILPITLICVDNIEADDTIAYIVKQYYDKSENKITIISTDQDFLQLVDDRVKVYNPIKKIVFTPIQIREKYLGILPENFLLYRIMSGDSSDSIDGVKGVGLKTLIKRFPQLKSEKVEIEQLYELCGEPTKKPVKIFSDILSNKEIISRNEKLMQLETVDISGHAKMNIINKMNAPITPTDVHKFKKLYVEDKLYANIKDVDLWLRDTFNKLNVYANRKI